MDEPIVKATAQAASLSALSNFLAQCITVWQKYPHLQSSFNPSDFLRLLRLNFNFTDLFHFFLFSVLACPPNYLWQSWLEGQFPAYTRTPPASETQALADKAVSSPKAAINGDVRKRVNGALAGAPEPSDPLDGAEKAEETLSLRNTGIKFALDQTLGATVNTALFIAGLALLRGHSFASIMHDLRTQFWPMIFAGQKLWPAVSLLNFTVVPFEYRQLVGSIVGLCWGVYLSLVSSEN